MCQSRDRYWRVRINSVLTTVDGIRNYETNVHVDQSSLNIVCSMTRYNMLFSPAKFHI